MYLIVILKKRSLSEPYPLQVLLLGKEQGPPRSHSPQTPPDSILGFLEGE